jgi:hypothetical protein
MLTNCLHLYTHVSCANLSILLMLIIIKEILKLGRGTTLPHTQNLKLELCLEIAMYYIS